jgi:hypothetical protein
MRNQYDIAAYSSDRQLVLIADIKAGKEISEENAAHFRRNLLAHGLLVEVPYFLLAYKTHFFLWKGAASRRGQVLRNRRQTTSSCSGVAVDQ